MRKLRVKVDGESYYHVTSRCALQAFLMKSSAKSMFVKMMRRAEEFSCVHVLAYCVMDNHFHILVKVPAKREIGEEELKRKIEVLYGPIKAARIFKRWETWLESGDEDAVCDEQESYRARMFDVSEFVKTLKQRYSLWFCSNNLREDGSKIEGTIWQGRFHSVLVENTQKALAAVAAYIDLNPVRAGIVSDAKSYRWSGYGAAHRGDGEAKVARKAMDLQFHEEIVKEKQRGFDSRVAGLSRGIAFGSTDFVTIAIRNASKKGSRINTVPKPFAELGCLSQFRIAARYGMA